MTQFLFGFPLAEVVWIKIYFWYKVEVPSKLSRHRRAKWKCFICSWLLLKNSDKVQVFHFKIISIINSSWLVRNNNQKPLVTWAPQPPTQTPTVILMLDNDASLPFLKNKLLFMNMMQAEINQFSKTTEVVCWWQICASLQSAVNTTTPSLVKSKHINKVPSKITVNWRSKNCDWGLLISHNQHAGAALQ